MDFDMFLYKITRLSDEEMKRVKEKNVKDLFVFSSVRDDVHDSLQPVARHIQIPERKYNKERFEKLYPGELTGFKLLAEGVEISLEENKIPKKVFLSYPEYYSYFDTVNKDRYVAKLTVVDHWVSDIGLQKKVKAVCGDIRKGKYYKVSDALYEVLRAHSRDLAVSDNYYYYEWN